MSRFGPILATVFCVGYIPETHADPLPVQVILTAPKAVPILGGDNNTSGIVSNVKLILTRDVLTSNKETTYWSISYNYYNGSFRWEDYQEIYIDFVDNLGVVLLTHGVVVAAPSNDCHYGGGIVVTQKGIMDFDFRNHEITINVSGSTPIPGHPNKDHHC